MRVTFFRGKKKEKDMTGIAQLRMKWGNTVKTFNSWPDDQSAGQSDLNTVKRHAHVPTWMVGMALLLRNILDLNLYV